MVTAKPTSPYKLGAAFYKLRERSAKEFFFSLFATCAIYSPENIARLLKRELPVERIVTSECTVVDIVVYHLRDELRTETLRYCRIGVHYGIEFGCGVHKVGISEFEQCQSIWHMAAETPVVIYRRIELRHFKVMGTIEQIGVKVEARPV